MTLILRAPALGNARSQKLTRQSIEDQILGGLPLDDKKHALHFQSMFARYGRLITDFSVQQNSRNCCLETAVYIGGLLRPCPISKIKKNDSAEVERVIVRHSSCGKDIGGIFPGMQEICVTISISQYYLVKMRVQAN